MTSRRLLAAALALLLTGSLAGPAAADPAAADPPGLDLGPRPERAGLAETVPGVLLVTTASRAATDRLAAATPGTQRLAQRVSRVTVPRGQERALAARLAKRPDVLAVEPARYRRLLATPDDPLYPRQWAHQLADVELAWDLSTGSASVTAAVIDNGVDGRHRDLRANMAEQRVFAGGSSYTVSAGSDNRTCSSEHGGDHATHVAGILGARGGDGVGVAGVAWQVRLLDFAVFSSVDGECAASDVDVLAALREATAADADVINLSLGGFVPEEACSTAFQTAIDEARAAGTVVVAASGNSEEDPAAAGQPTVPASCNGVISVGAVTVDGEVASYSTTNEHVDVVAPGGDRRTGFADGILSTVGSGGHDWLEGTSMAAPYVAGIVALLRSTAPDLTPDQVEALLERSAIDLGPPGRDRSTGWGRVDAGDAVALASEGARPEPEPDPDFPVADGGGGTLRPPPSGDPEVYRVAAGTGTTSTVPQSVATSQATFADGTAEHAVLARADGFADALAGSALTLGYGPLLFSGSTGPLPAATREELRRSLPAGRTVYLLGGTSALPASVEAELRALGYTPVRLAGRTREETAVAVARELPARRSALGLGDPGMVLLATGRDWPDAVTAGSLGAYYGIPILVTPPDSLHPAPADLLRRLRPGTVLVVGGPAAVSEATRRAAASAAGVSQAVRVAGSDRYATAVAVADLFEGLLGEAGVMPSCVLVVNVVRPDAYAHALSAGVLAGGYGCVIVPAEGGRGERLPAVTRGYVFGFGVDGVVVGDVDVVSAAAASDLEQLLQR